MRHTNTQYIHRFVNDCEFLYSNKIYRYVSCAVVVYLHGILAHIWRKTIKFHLIFIMGLSFSMFTYNVYYITAKSPVTSQITRVYKSHLEFEDICFLLELLLKTFYTS